MSLMSEKWHQEYLNQLDMQPFKQLEQCFALSQFEQWPNAQGLNRLAATAGGQGIPEFVCQSQLADIQDYYEQIIYQRNLVPTRPNSWHDLFNGLIWLQFPQTKRVLNQQHVQDIQESGLSPRTKRRNKLTHFDECGVIITFEKVPNVQSTLDAIYTGLKQHEWHKVFVEHRACWSDHVQSFMFGHANLEMLLNPYIGLTGKWVGLDVPSGFSTLGYGQQCQQIDTLLAEKISTENLFNQADCLSPMPLLGLPGVWQANTNPEFYGNRDYFRPKRKAAN
jgi:hypothetical protein